MKFTYTYHVMIIVYNLGLTPKPSNIRVQGLGHSLYNSIITLIREYNIVFTR